MISKLFGSRGNMANISSQRYILFQAHILFFTSIRLMSPGLTWINSFEVTSFHMYEFLLYIQDLSKSTLTITILRKYSKTKGGISNDLKINFVNDFSVCKIN